jgi:hypothetical protein
MRCDPQPSNTTLFEMSEITFTCSVEYTGYMAPSLLWQSDMGEHHGIVNVNSTHVT